MCESELKGGLAVARCNKILASRRRRRRRTSDAACARSRYLFSRTKNLPKKKSDTSRDAVCVTAFENLQFHSLRRAANKHERLSSLQEYSRRIILLFCLVEHEKAKQSNRGRKASLLSKTSFGCSTELTNSASVKYSDVFSFYRRAGHVSRLLKINRFIRRVGEINRTS